MNEFMIVMIMMANIFTFSTRLTMMGLLVVSRRFIYNMVDFRCTYLRSFVSVSTCMGDPESAKTGSSVHAN